MSEVFGIACADSPHTRHDKSLKEQVQIFETLLLHSEDNGGDASGVFFVERDNDNKSKSGLFKIDLPSSKLMKRGEYIDLVQRFFGKGLQIALGHCRKASAVAKTNNKHNNHPIVTRGVVGTHVGAITNHKKLWKEFGGAINGNTGKHTWQNGDVDSEIIFYLIGKQLRETNPPSFEGAIIEASKKLEGTYACAAVDLWRPGYVMLFTNQKEMYYYYSPSYNQIIFSTDFDILRTSLESAGFTILDSYKNTVPAHSGLRINADEAKLRPFVLASEKVTDKVAKDIVASKTGGEGP